MNENLKPSVPIEEATKLLTEFDCFCKRYAKKQSETKALTTHADENDGKRVFERTRTRRFSIISYIDVGSLKRFLGHSPWVQHFAMICHDKDKFSEEDQKQNEEHIAGTNKQVHCHILLYTYDAKTITAVKKIFDRYAREICTQEEEPQNTFVQMTTDPVSQYRYLMHLDDPDKHTYSENEIVCDKHDYWVDLVKTQGLNDGAKNVSLAILDDMISGVSTYDLVKRYGREFAINQQRYFQLYIQILKENNKGKKQW